MEKKLNEVWIGAFKLRANLARFSRSEQTKRGETAQHMVRQNRTPSVISPGTSYTDIVKRNCELSRHDHHGYQKE
ncbi:hypothetical protein Ancab_004549, partial [Ancistrocladus abbreviatus]